MWRRIGFNYLNTIYFRVSHCKNSKLLDRNLVNWLKLRKKKKHSQEQADMDTESSKQTKPAVTLFNKGRAQLKRGGNKGDCLSSYEADSPDQALQNHE